MTEDVIIRKVNENDFDGLVQLCEEVWPDVDYDKRNKMNYILRESIGVNYCAELSGKIVGSRLSFYQNFYWGIKKLKNVQFADSCIHPVCRGKGVFINLDKAFLKDFFSEQNGGELVYNISVIASRKAHEKCGWKYIESLMKLRKFPHILKTLWKIGFNYHKLNVHIDWEHENDVQPIDPDLLRIREEVFTQKPLLHMRYDEGTFHWRLKAESGIKSFFAPDLGYVIYKIGHRGKLVEVEIGEMFLYEYTKNTFKKLLKEFNKCISPDILWVMISEGHPLRTFYSSSWFLANPKQKYLHHGVRVETDEMREICYNPKNWAISSLDIDTF